MVRNLWEKLWLKLAEKRVNRQGEILKEMRNLAYWGAKDSYLYAMLSLSFDLNGLIIEIYLAMTGIKDNGTKEKERET